MQEAGIDTALFGEQSAMGASKAFAPWGSSGGYFFNAADWSSDSTFKRFYFEPVFSIAALVVDKL